MALPRDGEFHRTTFVPNHVVGLNKVDLYCPPAIDRLTSRHSRSRHAVQGPHPGRPVLIYMNLAVDAPWQLHSEIEKPRHDDWGEAGSWAVHVVIRGTRGKSVGGSVVLALCR